MQESWLLIDQTLVFGYIVDISSVESLQFDLDVIKSATNDFSPDNKLGQGGFGEVYKVYISISIIEIHGNNNFKDHKLLAL